LKAGGSAVDAAITLAEEGFPVTPVIAGYWKSFEASLQKTPQAGETFLIDGLARQAGEIFRNPRLAATYRKRASQARTSFIMVMWLPRNPD